VLHFTVVIILQTGHFQKTNLLNWKKTKNILQVHATTQIINRLQSNYKICKSSRAGNSDFVVLYLIYMYDYSGAIIQETLFIHRY
jgi:hypothetical protein